MDSFEKLTDTLRRVDDGSDPRNGFLLELKELLKKYDASIEVYVGENDETFADEPYIEFSVGFLQVTYKEFMSVINKDNVLDTNYGK